MWRGWWQPCRPPPRRHGVNRSATDFVNPERMTAIGPGFTSVVPPAQTGASPGARAAQAAFFRTAMSATQTIQPVAPIAAPTPQVRTALAEDAAETRPSRPGALLDIRV